MSVAATIALAATVTAASATPASTVSSPAAIDAPSGALAGPPGITITTTMTDPNDTQGRLDLSSVGHRVAELRSGRVQVAYRLETFKSYRDGLLDSPDREFVIELHRTATRGADRNITVSSVGGELVARIISNATRRPIARARIDRLDGGDIRIVGSRRLIGARSYFVTSNFHAGGSAECGWDAGWPVTCQDSVPDDGWIRVDRLGWPDLG